MKLIQLFFLLLFLNLNLSGQISPCYYYKLNLIKDYYYKHNQAGNLDSILLELKFEEWKSYNFELPLLLSKIYNNKQDSTNTEIYAKKYIDRGGEYKYLNFITVGDKAFNQRIKYYYYDQSESRNLSLIEKITQYYDADQFIRKLFDKNRTDSFLIKMLRKTDSTTANNLFQIFENEGFPKLKEIGLDAFSKLWILLLHNATTSTDVFLKFIPYLNKAIFTGDMAPLAYSCIVDRYYLFTLKKPIEYGNYNIGCGHEFCDIREIENVDIRRYEVGLHTLDMSLSYENSAMVLPEKYNLNFFNPPNDCK